jgi:hypothetical protein
MDSDDRNRLQYLGLTLVVGAVAGAFLMIATDRAGMLNLGFCTLIIALGFCGMWPALGVWLFDAVPRALVKVMPSKVAGVLRPDRRNDGGGG